jgi:hypothetical protein
MRVYEVEVEEGIFGELWYGRSSILFCKKGLRCRIGDITLIKEIRYLIASQDPKPTGREILAKVIYKITNVKGLKKDWNILELKKLEQVGEF